MSDFDKSTERKAEQIVQRALRINREDLVDCGSELRCAREGRNSAKESMEILAREMEKQAGDKFNPGKGRAIEAIAAVKARGDWPLEKRLSVNTEKLENEDA